MLTISKKQIEELGSAVRCAFIDRLGAALRAARLEASREVIAAHVDDAISCGLVTEVAASTYVNCMRRLERRQLDTGKLRVLAMRTEIEATQRLIVLTMLTERLERIAENQQAVR